VLIIIAAVLIGMAILFFVIISSVYFINSIVRPIGDVSITARRIAQGDFEARLAKETDDEIGELCDSINYMAGELKTTDKLKNDFISSVSHELRTPLTAIKGWCETIIDSGSSDKETLERGLGVISSETDRLSGMVEELLDFSRMQSGRLKLIFERIDLLAELGEAVMIFTERARREGIALVYDEPEAAAPVHGDRNRLRQVFINIIDNAFKYSDTGGRVKIAARLEDDWVSVTIADTGCGIAPDDLPKVKQKFYKANSSRRGSGIGLAVADEIIVMHVLLCRLTQGTPRRLRQAIGHLNTKAPVLSKYEVKL
jgi:signal transduction histidine kinase